MAATGSIGGLNVSVSLDIKNALKQLEILDRKLKEVLSGTAGGGAAGVATTQINTTNNSLVKTAATAVVARTALDKLRDSTKGVGKEMNTLGQAAVLSRRNPLAALSAGAKSLSGGFKALGAAGIAAGIAIGVVAAAAIAATAAVGGLVFITNKLAKLGLDSARELEVLNLSMEAITGSSAAASQEIRTLQRIAIGSPFLTTTIINLDKFLLSQGVTSGALREGLVTAVLDLSAALGLADENLGSITYALAQVQARGYLSGDEMRQLANQFIPVIESLRSLEEYSDLSNEAIRKLIEQGDVSSTTFFNALIASTEKYEGISAKAALTTDGLINKLEDVTRIALGQSFIDVDALEASVSPLGAFNDLLLSIVNLFERIDWKPFAAAMGELTQALTGPISDYFSSDSGAGQLIGFFQSWLPNAILRSAQTVMFFGEVVRALWKAFASVAHGLAVIWQSLLRVLIDFGISWGQVFMLMAAAAASAFVSMAVAAHIVVGALGVLVGAAIIVVAAFAGVAAAMSFDFKSAARAWNAGITGAQTVVTSFGNAIKGPAQAIVDTVGALDDLGSAFNRIKNIKIPNFAQQSGLEGFVDLTTTGGGAGGGAGGGGGTASSVDEIAKIMDMLFDLTRRWRGFRSELEVGFLGKDGFSATIDQILAMGQKLDEALIGLGRSDVADYLYASTERLIALAVKRDELTEELADATGNLTKLIRERDQFSAQLRSSAIKFAAALKVETESIKSYELVSNRGFFIETEQKRQKDFVKTLKERAQALKDFFHNIKALQAAGLDEDLLESLLTAGPDQSGETAAALVQGGKEMVDSVNVIYKDIEKTADLLAEFGANEFHQAGVDQAQALVDGLTADLEIVQVAAEDIVAVIYETVAPFTQEMVELGKAASGGLGAGISSGAGAVGAGMKDVIGFVDDGFDEVQKILDHRKGSTADTFDLMTNDWISDMVQTSLDIITEVDDMVLAINTSLDNIRLNPLKLELPSLQGLKESGRKMMEAIWDGVRESIRNAPYSLLSLFNFNITSGWFQGYSVPGGRSDVGSYSTGTLAATPISPQTSNSAGGGGPYAGGVPDTVGPPVIKVYIGDQELRGLVRTEVIYNDVAETSRVLTGRRA